MANQVTDELILEIIDKCLSSLGENPKNAVWFCIEKDFTISHQEAPKKLETVEKILQSIFGLGYNFLEALFREYLVEVTGEDLSGKKGISECVSYLRSKNKSSAEK
jgi:hypothetical protein